MSFDFSSDRDRQDFMSLKGMINRREGVFYSPKQAKFVFGNTDSGHDELAYGPESYEEFSARSKKFFGVDVYPGERVVYVTAQVRWSEYGGRSCMPVSWGFVIDQNGVTRLYKVAYKGNLRDGAAPNPSKTKLEWTRGEAAAPFLAELKAKEVELKVEQKAQQAVDAKSTFVGEIGERIEKTMTLRHRMEKDGDWGGYYVFVMNDEEGNVYFMNGGVDNFDDDGIAKIRATVKNHFNTKAGVKATRLARPHFVKAKG